MIFNAKILIGVWIESSPCELPFCLFCDIMLIDNFEFIKDEKKCL